MKYSFLGQRGQHAGDYLGLSIAGAIKIAPYAEECHNDALDNYVSAEKKISIKDPLRFYIFLCNDYCKTRFIDPDFPTLTKLANQYNIDASTDVYLPAEQRVKVKIEETNGYKKSGKPHKESPNKNCSPYEGNPYRPVLNSWKKSAHEFPFSPTKPFDHIGEAIKLVGYIAAGIQGSTANVPPTDCFAKRAAFTVDNLVVHHEKYKLELSILIEQIDKFIEYALTVHQDMPHIKQISSAEDAKLEAHRAIAEFIPMLLQPFIAKEGIL